MTNVDEQNWRGLEEATIRPSFEGVSLAQPSDEDEVFAMLLQLHAENGVFKVDEEKVRDFIRHGTEQRGGIIGVIRGETKIEASVGLTLDQWWYTKDWCLSERWNFVLPEHRRSSHAIQLIEYAKWCAERLKMPLQMGIISTHQTEAKIRLYGRRMRPVGGLFMYNAPDLPGVH